jgi:hypothetical protein
MVDYGIGSMAGGPVRQSSDYISQSGIQNLASVEKPAEASIRLPSSLQYLFGTERVYREVSSPWREPATLGK